MEATGYSVAGAILMILFRDGLPALGKFLSRVTANRRAVSADDREADQEQEATTVAELKKLVAMLQKDATDNRLQIHGLRDQCNANSMRAATCEAREAAKDERIAALEDALTRAGIPFYKRPSGDSGHHFPHATEDKKGA